MEWRHAAREREMLVEVKGKMLLRATQCCCGWLRRRRGGRQKRKKRTGRKDTTQPRLERKLTTQVWVAFMQTLLASKAMVSVGAISDCDDDAAVPST